MPADLSFDRAIAFARDLIRIPGPPGAEGAVAERVRQELEALGFHEVRTDEVGNVVGRFRGQAGGPTVMLSSHLDVVDPGDPTGWEHPPYGGDIAGGFLHGRGAMDIKGPLALQTYAAARAAADGAPGDVVVAHTVLEERGGWGMAHLLASGGVRPDAVIIGEATSGDVCIGHRGRAEPVLELAGIAGHASAPDRARNPIYALPAVLEAVRSFAAGLDADPVLGPATLAPTGLDASPASHNVIPDLVRVVLDWRVLPGWSAERAAGALERHLREHAPLPDGVTLAVRVGTEHQRTWTGLEEERLLFTPGFLLPRDHPVARAAAAAVERATGRAPRLRPWTFATDGGHACGVHGIPTIGYAPGEERHAHTNRERLDLAAARTAFEAYPSVIRAVMEAAARR